MYHIKDSTYFRRQGYSNYNRNLKYNQYCTIIIIGAIFIFILVIATSLQEILTLPHLNSAIYALDSNLDTATKFVFIDLGARKGNTLELFYHTHYNQPNLPNSDQFIYYAFEIDSTFESDLQSFCLNHKTKRCKIIMGAATNSDQKLLTMYLHGLGTKIITGDVSGVENINYNNVSLCTNKKHPSNVDNPSFTSGLQSVCQSVMNINFIKFMNDNFNNHDFIVLKIDVEGGEFDLISSLIENEYEINFLLWINALHIEWHHAKRDHVTIIPNLAKQRYHLRQEFAKHGLRFINATYPIDWATVDKIHSNWTWDKMKTKMNDYNPIWDEHWWRV